VSEDDYLGYLVPTRNAGSTGDDDPDGTVPQTLGGPSDPTRDVATIGEVDLETARARLQPIEVRVKPERSSVVCPEHLETSVTTKNGGVGDRDPAVTGLAIDENLADHSPGR
jgi:hypothetical protein